MTHYSNDRGMQKESTNVNSKMYNFNTQLHSAKSKGPGHAAQRVIISLGTLQHL